MTQEYAVRVKNTQDEAREKLYLAAIESADFLKAIITSESTAESESNNSAKVHIALEILKISWAPK